ncbi:polysaccharide deacetylase family protein [Pseudomaricurvus alcaniphilus]|uniref:polysaccharide deacetylase family protein n=1 Tax=Pseudomaricurvus alcaniphilus TaxID=1166482 RepID=UPI001A9F7FA2|nr:polysaccharide deacetylase family protein [Pseudomaricurvus alcaniphilus]
MSAINRFESLFDPIRLIHSDGQPSLSVVVDTEEEFDWSLPHNRQATATKAIREVERGQAVFDRYGLKPCYVIDYPIASNTEDNAALRDIQREGRCVIGTHLHPWVTPPHEEEVCSFNSFPGNLAPELERQKLEVMTRVISENFGRAPICYKAGRYGVGPATAQSLYELGYRIDLSVTPGFDYAPQSGPDYSRAPNLPFWFGPGLNMFELPCSGGFCGLLGARPERLYQAITSSPGMKLRIPGIFARLGLLERIRLSPEGFTLEEMKRITRYLLKAGVRHFTMSFHSPSLVEGYTPYVATIGERQAFLDRIDSYLEFFATELNGAMTDPESLYQRLKPQ